MPKTYEMKMQLTEAVGLLRECPGMYSKWRDRARWLERRKAFLERMDGKNGKKGKEA